MREEHDLTGMKGSRNRYAKRLKKQVTIRLGTDVIEYFKTLAAETGIPYQNLINLYLRDCVASGRRPSLVWGSDDVRHPAAPGPKARPSTDESHALGDS